MEQEIKHKKIEDYQEKIVEAPKEEAKIEENKVEKKEKKEKIKKEEAVVNGNDLQISTKNSIFICKFIMGKQIEEAVYQLDKVLNKKMVLPMIGEYPHRHGDVKIGRYPKNATEVFIKLLKGLNANAQVNGIENPYIYRAVANLASRPYKRFGSQRFKRTNVLLIAREKK